MEVRLQKLGKRYSRHWIFRDLHFTIQQGEKIAIVGPNGSGKSTLIQIVSGAQPMTEGKVSYSLNNNELNSDNVFQFITFAAPYTQLVEELNLLELYHFHKAFKTFQYSFDQFYELLEYPFKKDQPIKFYSSGMKQRIKLALALLSQAHLVLLDEPTSNLDHTGKEWYLRMIADHLLDKTLIIASNEPEEYKMTNRQISIS